MPILTARWRLSEEWSRGIRPHWKPEGLNSRSWTRSSASPSRAPCTRPQTRCAPLGAGFQASSGPTRASAEPRTPGAGLRHAAGHHIRGDPLSVCPRGPRLASLRLPSDGPRETGGWRLLSGSDVQVVPCRRPPPCSSRWPLRSSRCKARGGEASIGLSLRQPESFVDFFRLGRNRRATAVAWHCLRIPAPPWGRPSLAFPRAALWRRCPGQSGGMQAVTKALQ